MLNLLFNTLLTITPHNTQKRRRRKKRTTYGPLRQSSRWVTHPVRNPDWQGLTWAPELKLNFSGRNSFLGGIFCLEYPSRRNENRLRVVPHFSYNYRFSFRKLQNLYDSDSVLCFEIQISPVWAPIGQWEQCVQVSLCEGRAQGYWCQREQETVSHPECE